MSSTPDVRLLHDTRDLPEVPEEPTCSIPALLVRLQSVRHQLAVSAEAIARIERDLTTALVGGVAFPTPDVYDQASGELAAFVHELVPPGTAPSAAERLVAQACVILERALTTAAIQSNGPGPSSADSRRVGA